jgi:rhodanese-related sulfurtransferase
VADFMKGNTMSQSLSASALYGMLGLPQAPILVDVRRHPAYEELARILPGAQRGEPERVEEWAAGLPKARPVLVYCVHGHEVSQGAAATLTTLGFDASYLEGGIAGWIDAGLPTLARRPEWQVPASGLRHSRWITRERPKIDRLACPWLVRRFIDPRADFFYVPAPTVRSQGEALHAQPYDIPDTVFSHRGPLCSFDAFLAEFDLHDPALDAMAQIVRAADTGTLDAAPQAAGLLAISLGLGATVRDDMALLEAAMPLYDALYAWCKTARGETHNWPFGAQVRAA